MRRVDVVEAALTRHGGGVARFRTPLAAGLLLSVLVALVATGEWPELRSRTKMSPRGLLALAPGEIHRVEIRDGTDGVALHRKPSGWSVDGMEGAAPEKLASHLETAIKFVNVSEPAREIKASELSSASFAEFGLDPPASVAVLATEAKVAATVNFGSLNPAGTSNYVRLGGAPTVYLLSRHVSEEWRLVFDMARRLKGQSGPAAASRGTNLLLPVSMAQVWAIEIVFAGKLTRFERDGAGNWFRHVGQHTHNSGANAHVADPAQAQIIDSTLRAFDSAAVETSVAPADAARHPAYGLALPMLIALFYARDSSTPVAQLEFGAPSDSLDRYARLKPDGAVVTVAEFEVRRLTELLKAAGEGS
jgi:hypothetical protein